MVYEIENLLEKFKDLDKHFQWIPGAVPRRNPAFLVGKALHKVDSETDFPAALVDYSTIGKYLRKSHNVSDFATRITQIVLPIYNCSRINISG